MDRQVEQLVWRRAQRRLGLDKSADQPQLAPLPELADRLKKTASLDEDVASLPRSVMDACERLEEDWNLTKEAMDRSGHTKLSENSIHLLAHRYSHLAKLAGVNLTAEQLEESVIDTSLDGVFDAFMSSVQKQQTRRS